MRNSNVKFGIFAGLTAAALLGGIANGQTWTEAGDAPDLLPGQETQGSGALTQINGNHDANDADLFKITITDAGGFSATTTGGSSLDTQLFLFDANGMGVTHDDDDPNGGLQSRISGQFVPGPGVYYLAISTYNMDPSSAGGLIWANSPFNVERQPDGPGAGSPLSSWGTGGSTAGTYSIFLTGAGFGNGGGGCPSDFTATKSGTCPTASKITWTGAPANSTVRVLYTTSNGTGGTIPPSSPCPGKQICIGLAGVTLHPQSFNSDGSGGGATPNFAAPCGLNIQLITQTSCKTSNKVTL